MDASSRALDVARRNLASLDVAYSLGVLQHIPDNRTALRACIEKLKPGAPFLLYLYYRFDHKPRWYRLVWSASELGRSVISRLPYGARYWLSQVLAAGVYWPMARLARFMERAGFRVNDFRLAYYRTKGFYVMRTDTLDRFGTRLEQRFTKVEMHQMMVDCGLRDISFSDQPPFWCAFGYRNESA